MKDDTISRAAALDALPKKQKGIGGESWMKTYRRSGYNDCVEDCMKALQALPSVQPGWIPCDRELPKPNEEDGNGFYKAYLVQDGRWMDVARWDGKYWIAWGYSTVLLNVVAWMPLPTPYREGKEQ